MKNIYLSLTILVAFLALSCQKENCGSDGGANSAMTISAVAEEVDAQLTRVQMAQSYIVQWKTSDQIFVKGEETSAPFILTDGEDTPRGTFSNNNSPFKTGDAVKAYYPLSLVSGEKLVWPAKQDYDLQVPMYCEKTLTVATGEEFNFSSLGGIIQIVFNTTKQADVVRVTEVEVRDGQKPLSGEFTIDDKGKAVIVDDPAGKNTGVILDLGTGVDMGKGVKYFSLALPVGEYNEFSIDFVYSDGTICTVGGLKMNIKRNAVSRVCVTGEECHVAPISVSLDKTAIEIESSDKTAKKLTATIYPENVTNKKVSWKSSNTEVATVDANGNVTAVAEGTAIITVTTNDRSRTATCNVTVTSTALNNAFSVSATTKVRFSSGNLQAKFKGSSSYEWSFAPHQYNFIGGTKDLDGDGKTGNNKISKPDVGDVVDLFGWSTDTDGNNWGILSVEGSNEFGDNFKDWGPQIGESWRTLTSEEWQYLFNGDKRTGLCAYGVTVVGSQCCIILYPDGYAGIRVNNGDTSSYDTEEEWAAAEKEGVVCLPAAGYRTKDKVYTNNYGRYWSSTPTTDKLNLVQSEEEDITNGGDDILYSKSYEFKGSDAGSIKDGTRYVGRSVRLVTNVQ